MYGRNASFILLLLALLPLSAQAKNYSLSKGRAFGIGFKAGAEMKPSYSPISGTNSNFSRFFVVEPTIDFSSFILRLSAGLHYHPLRKSSGTNSVGNYSDSSENSSFHYGLQALFVPYVSESDKSRLYFFLGLGQAIASLSNKRNYLDASGNTTLSYKEKLRGTKEELNAGLGFETMLVQNYSFAIEAGYRLVNFDRLTYDGTTDLAGTPWQNGDVAKNTNGTNKEFNLSGAFLALGINLHF